MANTAVFGLYSAGIQAGEAIDELRLQGFRGEDVSVLFAEKEATWDFAVGSAAMAAGSAATGGAPGAVVRSVLGWLWGNGAVAIPGSGPVIASGPIAAALAGAANGAISATLVGLGLPEHEAKRYESRIRSGSLLLSIHCDDAESARSARQLLEQTGARNICSGSKPEEDFANSDNPGRRAA